MLKKLDALRARVLNDPLWTALLFLPFFEPVGLGGMFEPIYWVFIAWKAVSILFACLFFLSRPKCSALTAAIGAYQVVLLVSTLVNHASLAEWAFKAGVTAGMCLLVDQCVDTNIQVMLKGLFFTLGALCLANLATVVLFPGGMPYGPEKYLLGIDNVHALFLVPVMGIAALYSISVGWPFAVRLCLAVLFSASLFITWSVTGMLAAAAFVALLVLGQIRKSYRLFNVGVYYGVIVAVLLALFVFRLPEHMSVIIDRLFHKTATLSSRVPLWDLVLGLIREKPLLGHGKLSGDAMMLLCGGFHCHNIILQTLFDTGAVGLALFLAEMGLLVRPLWRTRGSKCGYVLAAAVFAILLYCMAEGQVYPMGYTCLFMMAFHAEKITAILEPDALPGER